jgi:carboxyl-terminal processing protease
MLWFLFLAGCIATPSDHPVDVFEGVWGDFDRLYGGFEARGVDWDAEYDEWRPAVDDGSSEDELWDALTGLLTTLDDGHVRLLAPDRDMFESNHVYRDREMEGTFDDQVVRTYLTDIDTGPWDWYLRGTVAPRVAYVWFPGIDDNTYVIDTIVDGGPDALIIDLRHSHGGATTYAMHGTGRLTEQDQVTCSTRSRNGPGSRGRRRRARRTGVVTSTCSSTPRRSAPVSGC